MKIVFFSKSQATVLMLALCLMVASGLPSASAGNPKGPHNVSLADDMPVYNSPEKNAAIRRREAGNSSRSITRGNRSITRSVTRSITRRAEAGEKIISLPSRMVVLAPRPPGLASKSQPALLWYISDPWPGKIEFVISETGSEKDMLVTQFNGPDKEGVYQISLSDLNVKLRPGAEYEWFVTIIPDNKERSSDFSASGAIRYVRPSSDLSERLEKTSKDRLYYVYAEHGYWYDAIESLSRMIDAKPDDKRLKSHRVALLDQVKLPLEAAYDRKF